MLRRIPLLLALVGCAAPTALDDDPDFIGGKADGAVLALEGTREGHGVLRLLNDGEGTTFTFLDEDVALNRRTATNLIAHRDGPDATFGTADDALFETIGEVDAVSWVGPSALERLAEFARLNDYVPGDNDELGTFDGVSFTFANGEDVLAFVNDATESELAEASVPSRAVASIFAARPIDSVRTLADLYWVGPRTLEHLLAAVALPVGGEPCATTVDCSEGLRCIGRPSGFGYGKCRDLSSVPGVQEPCDTDAQCNPGLICIAQTVYERGYCTDAWMRETFVVGGISSIPQTVMTRPTASRVTVYGQASVPEDIIVEIDIEHSDPSSLWIGLEPPTGQEPVTLWDGATMTGPLPTRFEDRAIYRDDAVNGRYRLLIQNVGGRGEGVVRGFTLQVTSRWD